MEFQLTGLLFELASTFIVTMVAVAMPHFLKSLMRLVDEKQTETLIKIENEKVRARVNEAIDLIQAIVLETAQTFVDPLKDLGEWDAVTAEEAKQLAIDKAMDMLSTDGVEFLTDLYGDASEWIAVQIEAFLKDRYN